MDEDAYTRCSPPDIRGFSHDRVRTSADDAAIRLRPPPHRPLARDIDAMLEAVGAESLDALMRETMPASIRQKRAARSRRSRCPRPRRWRTCARSRRRTRSHLADRAGLLRHRPAGGDPAQHPGKSGLVHRLHALSAGNQPGPAGSAAQFPDHGLRSDRARCRQCLAARRGDRRGGSDGAGAARGESEGKSFFVDREVHPQTLAVLRRAPNRSAGRWLSAIPLTDPDRAECSARCSNIRARSGDVRDFRPAIAALRAKGGLAIVAADPLALTLLTPPGELGADIAIGSTQRFGVPMGYGGPHAAYMAVRDALKRALPGRLVGLSIDCAGNPPTASRCKRASSISAARRRPPTSAPRRCCWP